MCYENPLHLAEEISALDLLLDQRIAIGISRSSPEQARRGWEAFGYTSTDSYGRRRHPSLRTRGGRRCVSTWLG